MRRAPGTSPDLEKLKASKVDFAQSDTLSLDVELITPLFGGGVETKKVDEVCWLRASEVKASLRFWWRALYGHRYPTSKGLHEAESNLFGSAKGNEGVASPVAVGVVQTQAPKLRRLDLPQGDPMAAAYFPGLPGQGNNEEVFLGEPGAKARLSLVFRKSLAPALRKEVKEALVAFLILGGVGSRTRRGAGALAPVDPMQAKSFGYPASEAEFDDWIARFGKGEVQVAGPFFSLHRKGVLLRTAQVNTAPAAHTILLEHWRAFRQNRRHPDGFKGKAPWGQSRWPEGDVVRRFVRKNFSAHTPHESHTNQAPRALLGLPIVIHFKEQSREEHHQILHEASDRYASPVWLAVARTWNGTDKVHHGLVVAMPSVLPFRIHLEVRGRQDKLVLVPAYPAPRPGRPEEPPAHAVASAQDMVSRVAEAFTKPTNHKVKVPAFVIKNA